MDLSVKYDTEKLLALENRWSILNQSWSTVRLCLRRTEQNITLGGGRRVMLTIALAVGAPLARTAARS